MIIVCHYYFHRNAAYFPNPNVFLPQRFLPANPHSQAIDPNVYRPFERGIRNCPGQEVAMLMIKVMLCLLVRKFRFEEAYEELFRRQGRKIPITTFPENGDRAYQVLVTSAFPKDGLPMWVVEESPSI